MSVLAAFADTVRHAAPGPYLFSAAVSLIVALASLYGAFTFLKRKRLIEDTPTALIRSAAQGYIELEGRAELMDGDPIYAPLSNRPCVWWKYRVEQRQERTSNGRRDSRWVTIENGTSDSLFYLVDSTGRCAVDPEGAAVTPTERNTWYGSTRIPGRYHDDDGTWWARGMGSIGQRYRYVESRIEPGDPLYAIGEFRTHDGAAARFDKSKAAGDILREWKRDQSWMLQQFDANNDGQIDMQEWQQARAEAEKIAVAKHGEGGQPPPVDLMSRARTRGQPFVIHAGTEAEILKRYNWQLAALLSIGLPLLVMTLWSVAIRFGG